jgi:hypothetical protein
MLANREGFDKSLAFHSVRIVESVFETLAMHALKGLSHEEKMIKHMQVQVGY